MSKVQSVIVNKRFFYLDEAIDWVRIHGYKVKKIDETDNYYRFRQFNPKKYSSYITRNLNNGVKLIIGI